MAPQVGGAAALRAQEAPRAAETEATQGPIPPTGGLGRLSLHTTARELQALGSP